MLAVDVAPIVDQFVDMSQFSMMLKFLPMSVWDCVGVGLGAGVGSVVVLGVAVAALFVGVGSFIGVVVAVVYVVVAFVEVMPLI